MTAKRALGATLVAHISILVVLLISGCELDKVLSLDGQPSSDDALRMSVLFATADSVTIEARWNPVSDASGIDRYDWLNWRSTPDTVVAEASTPLLADTFNVKRPLVNETLTFGFQIRAVDGAGNAGSFSAAHMWSLANEDTLPPPPPDSVVVDTLFAAIAVWPADVEMDTGTAVQFYAAFLLVETHDDVPVDTSVVCDSPPPVPGALYDSGSFCCGCDSAAARLPWSNGGNAPALFALNELSYEWKGAPASGALPTAEGRSVAP